VQSSTSDSVVYACVTLVGLGVARVHQTAKARNTYLHPPAPVQALDELSLAYRRAHSGYMIDFWDSEEEGAHG